MNMNRARWIAAYERYCLAAVATGCFDNLAPLMKHKDNVLRLAEECKAKNKSTALAMRYDETARKAWDERAYSGLDGFNQNHAAAKLDRELVSLAETNLERAQANKGKGKDGKGKSDKGYGKGKSDKGKGKGGKSDKGYSSWGGSSGHGGGWGDDRSAKRTRV
jgi:hypothetical protein